MRFRCPIITVCSAYLILVDGVNFARFADERIGRAASVDNISYEMLLAIVRSQDRDLLGRVTEQAHVREHGDYILGFGQVLEEIRVRLRLTNTLTKPAKRK